MPKARSVQVPGESANPAGEEDGEGLDLSEASSGDLPAPVDVAELQAQLAAAKAENEALKAKAGKPAAAPAKPTAGGKTPELTAQGWVVPEPAPQPAKG